MKCWPRLIQETSISMISFHMLVLPLYTLPAFGVHFIAMIILECLLYHFGSSYTLWGDMWLTTSLTQSRRWC